MKKTGILTTAEDIVHNQRSHYAPPFVDFARASDLLNALGYRRYNGVNNFVTLGPSDLPVMMICVKLSRLMHEFNVDGLLDIAGYIECWGIVKDIHPEEED